MSTLSNAKITLRPSAARGHADHGWLNTYHTFSFASYFDPHFESFGALRVLNEDRVAPRSGFPTHPHRDAEIFSYIISGELTHRDSMMASKAKSNGPLSPDDYYVMKRGDVQFTTGGSGIAHAEQNEHDKETVHFLQIWALPWKKGLVPRYHTRTFDEGAKRKGFVTILSPLEGGIDASPEDEKAAVPTVEGTIPIHADFLMGASIIAPKSKATWKIGGDNTVRAKNDRKVYVHLPIKGIGAKVRVAEQQELAEGDGAFVENVTSGQNLVVESIGAGEAEVVVLDSN
ncbi:MAG: hypothetical protein LQ351_006273 [Letrouitia transgressa]|nr:MAG: hypothetical protein LQ351_006273 [Letrouitia transgressa]